MEISHVPVSKSLGNCEHLYNQMSSQPLWDIEKVSTQSLGKSHTHFMLKRFIKDKGAVHHSVRLDELFLHQQTHEGNPGDV